MNDWLIILTIVIPRLIMWYIGLLAVQGIFAYRSKVSGNFYKAALTNIALGIGGIILASIVLRCVQSLSSPLQEFGLEMILLTLYFLLFLLAAGYAVLAKGANGLRKIEDV